MSETSLFMDPLSAATGGGQVGTTLEPAPVVRRRPRAPAPQSWGPRAVLALSVVVGAVLRLVHLNALGFNSDEAVYAGQAASIAGYEPLLPYFPVFRAHPLLFQTVLSLAYHDGVSDITGRRFAVVFGLGTVVLAYLVGRELFDARVGAIAAAVMAVMPYHVVVSRQVILDGPMTFFATLSLLLLARWGSTGRLIYFYAGASALGLTVLSKEPSVVLVGAAFAFIAVGRVHRLRLRQLVIAGTVFFITVLPFPMSIKFSGRSSTGEQFLSYQILRRPNHPWTFYFEMLPPAIGPAVLVLAAVGVAVYARPDAWRDVLLLAWILVPLAFFIAWPVKGFQYLLPASVPVAVLAARTLVRLPELLLPRLRWLATAVAAAAVLATLAVPAWDKVAPSSAGTSFLAGSGGVPGGREAGRWVGANIPEGAHLLALGPSMANIIQFYGQRKTWGLSVSANPLHRNPVYEPVINPDNLIRSNEIQYLVWDSFSASRSAFFADRLMRFAERYQGRPIHTEYVTVDTAAGTVRQPVIVIYEVRP